MRMHVQNGGITRDEPMPVQAWDSVQCSRDPLQREFLDCRFQDFVFADCLIWWQRAGALLDSNQPIEDRLIILGRRWTLASNRRVDHQLSGQYQTPLPASPGSQHTTHDCHAAVVFAYGRCGAHPRHLWDHGTASPPFLSTPVVVHWRIDPLERSVTPKESGVSRSAGRNDCYLL